MRSDLVRTAHAERIDTNAYRIDGGIGADFAQYLFPQTFLGITIRPALTVRQWRQAPLNESEDNHYGLLRD